MINKINKSLSRLIKEKRTEFKIGNDVKELLLTLQKNKVKRNTMKNHRPTN
jgi:hypothetical protein